MNTTTYQAIVAAPGFCLGVQCDNDEITVIDFLEPRPEVAATTPLAAEAVRQLKAYIADPNFRFGLPLRRPAPPSSAECGNRFRPSRAARRTPTVNWQKSQKRAPCRRSGLRFQSLPDRRALPPRRRHRRRTGRLCPRTRRLPARRQTLAAAP